MIVVRRYREEDVDGTIVTFQTAVREVARRDYSPAQIAAWARVDRDEWAARREATPTWVALIDEQVAGFADLDDRGHLDMLYVNARDQRRGVAKALLSTLEAAALNAGLRKIRTEASLTARGFFEAHGFLVTAAQDVEHRGQTFRNFRMEKRLGD